MLLSKSSFNNIVVQGYIYMGIGNIYIYYILG